VNFIDDVNFIDTVAQWRYTPMLFRAASAPVRFGVGVSFVLN
jgi:hypothetical protein